MTTPQHPDPEIDTLVQAFTGGTPPRVWSLLVTVFGDLAQEEGQSIPGGVLSALTAPLGVRPEALRVALHRLRKDGWITSQRHGRTSTYALSAHGRAESILASPRIYGPPPQGAAYLLHCDPTIPEAPMDDAVRLAPGLWVALSPMEQSACLCLELPQDRPLPAWMRARLCSIDLTKDLADLATACGTLAPQIPAKAMSPLHRAGLRILIVHAWRRLSLRLPKVPDRLYGPTWPGASARQHVRILLQDLPVIGLDQLERAWQDTAS